MPFHYDPKTSFKPVPAGIHLAILTQVIELGMQAGYRGAPDVESIFLSYELPECFRDDGAPFKIGKQMTISFYEKANLAKHVNALHGNVLTLTEQKDFQVSSLLGKACNLIVTHTLKDNGDTFAKIQSVAPYTGKAPEPVTEPVFLDFLEQDPTVLESLPAWLQAIVAAGKPWPGTRMKMRADVKSDSFDNDIPF